MDAKRKNSKLGQEWTSLMKEAYQLGLSIVEVKEFINSNRKEFVPK
ncbi:DNA-binding anti-repressor SinI (plasmid) [Priestia aryabhattai]|nr:DNA-binding anti-repressor SinI [Priestia aryabhattai]MDH3135407.1 DNA-binding anti-repressor SinI [Priestia aryabhattai]